MLSSGHPNVTQISSEQPSPLGSQNLICCKIHIFRHARILDESRPLSQQSTKIGQWQLHDLDVAVNHLEIDT